MRLHRLGIFLLAAAAAVPLGTAAHAQSPAEFFSSKPMTFLVGAPAGGGYGLNARLLLQHLPKHIPGKPEIQIQFMDGAGGVKATNYLANVAPQDGSWIGMPTAAIVTGQLLNSEGVRFDGAKFHWLGTVARLNNVLTVWSSVPAKTWQDLRTQEVILGAPTLNSFTAREPMLIAHLLNLKIKVVTGYKGMNGVMLAMERGEVQGNHLPHATIVGTHPEWIKENKVRFLIQVGQKKSKSIPDVPLLLDQVSTQRDRQMAEFLHSTTELGRSVYAPPGVPADRAAALRKAVWDTTQDLAFIKDMESRGQPVDPVSGEEIQAMVERVVATPPDLIAQMRKVFAAQK